MPGAGIDCRQPEPLSFSRVEALDSECGATVILPKTPSFRIDGRRALVTGAGRGLGLAIAAALAEAGAMDPLHINRYRYRGMAKQYG